MPGIDDLNEYLAKAGVDQQRSMPATSATEAQVTGVSILESFLEKAEQRLPTGEPKLGGSGEEQGGALEGVGKTTGGNGGSGRAPDLGVPSCEKQILSEDDEDVENQLKDSDKKKPLEQATKSLNTSPQGQRDQTAYARARVIDQARRVQNVTVGVGLPPKKAEPESLAKSHVWRQGAESRVVYSDAADLAVERLIKSNGFYAGGTPPLARSVSPLRALTRCPRCQELLSKALTVCPHCGDQHSSTSSVKPAQGVYQIQRKSNGPFFQKAKPIRDLYLPNGVSLPVEEE